MIGEERYLTGGKVEHIPTLLLSSKASSLQFTVDQERGSVSRCRGSWVALAAAVPPVAAAVGYSLSLSPSPKLLQRVRVSKKNLSLLLNFPDQNHTSICRSLELYTDVHKPHTPLPFFSVPLAQSSSLSHLSLSHRLSSVPPQGCKAVTQ